MRLRHIVRTHRDLTGDLADDEYPSVGALARMRVARAARLSSRVAESLELVRSMLGAVLETHRSSVAERANVSNPGAYTAPQKIPLVPGTTSSHPVAIAASPCPLS